MYLLFDIGGTQMRFALTDGKNLKSITVCPTPRNYKNVLKKFSEITRQSPRKIDKVIGGVPRFSKDRLTFWHTHDTIKDIRKITQSPVVLKNDAELAALGEAVKGAGKNSRIVAYLTFSTGFGGSRIVNKKLDETSFGTEPKLQISNINRPTESVSFYASGRGLKNRYKKPAELITSKKAWTEAEKWMATAINDAAVFWSPDIIVLGGSVAMNKNISLSRLNKFISKRFKNMPRHPKIVKANLGQFSGLYGALYLVKNKTA
jgi:predicted NBD/HSP70 family sugar kinase